MCVCVSDNFTALYLHPVPHGYIAPRSLTAGLRYAVAWMSGNYDAHQHDAYSGASYTNVSWPVKYTHAPKCHNCLCVMCTVGHEDSRDQQKNSIWVLHKHLEKKENRPSRCKTNILPHQRSAALSVPVMSHTRPYKHGHRSNLIFPSLHIMHSKKVRFIFELILLWSQTAGHHFVLEAQHRYSVRKKLSYQ